MNPKNSNNHFEVPVQVETSGRLFVGWQSPSNIALVKYWGKTGDQVPINPSLSITLDGSVTRTQVHAKRKTSGSEEIQLRYNFDGKEHIAFQDKVSVLLGRLIDELPFLKDYSLEIESFNTFPHSAGIASSASSMSALALCLLSLNNHILKIKMSTQAFYKKASHLARLGSGSACRSVYGGYVLWGKYSEIPKSGNLFAIPLPLKAHALFANLHDSILIIDQGEKPVSSRAGHEKMNQHPFRAGRIRQVNQNITQIIKAISDGDWGSFNRIVENEALTLHALMMSSDPGFLLIQPNTLRAINKINTFRIQNNVKIIYTLDAGPNLHVLYPDDDVEMVKKFINNELASFCVNNFVIHDHIGKGPVQIDN